MIRLSLLSLLFACGEKEEETGISNKRPEIGNISINPETTTTTGTLTCSAEVTDPDGDEMTISYSWKDPVGNILSESDTLEITPEDFRPDDRVYCWVSVTDGISGLSQPKFTTIKNTDPVINSVDIESDMGAALLSATLTCSGSASDADLGTPSFSYQWLRADIEVGTQANLVLDPELFSEADELTCVATASDLHGGQVSESVSVTIENSAPVVDSVSLTPEEPISTDELHCAVESSDIDGDALSLAYAWDIDGTASTETAENLAGPFLVGSVVTCAVTANDGDVDSAPVSASVTISNTMPVVDSVDITAEPIYTDGTITATASLSDLDAEHTPTATYEWHVISFSDGVDSTAQTGAMETLDGSLFSKGDQVYVIVTANDTIADSASLTSSAVTISNTAPADISVLITSSDSFYNDSTLTCAATATDADSDTLTYTYSWSTGETGATLTLDSSLSPGSNISCTAVASDGTDTLEGESTTETLGNRAPSVDSVSITPNTGVAIGSEIVCSAAVSDPDGIAPTDTYSWQVGITEIATGSTYIVSGDDVSMGDSLTCVATATDASAETDSDSASVTIENANPTIANITISSNSGELYNDEILTCSASIDDADEAAQNLTVTYTWFSDSVELGTGETLDLTLEALLPEDDISCVIDVTDSNTGASSADLEETIGNRAPSTPVITLTWASSGESPTADEDITCSAESTDDDGGTAPTISYQWESDGGTIVSSETLSSSDTAVGEAWSCTATATDSIDNTLEASASEPVTIVAVE